MEGTIGEIRLFAGNFAPRTWAFCNGQLISIATNTALFSILGTTYGGNGTTNFALPDLQGRVAVGTGTGPGLPNVQLGEKAGANNVTLALSQMPGHTHTIGAAAVQSTNRPTNALPAVGGVYGTSLVANMAATGPAGGSQPFSIMQPYLGMNYIICMFGIFPSRN